MSDSNCNETKINENLRGSVVVQTGIRPPWSQVFGSGTQGRVPVEDDGVLPADDYLVTRHCAGLDQCVLHAEGGESIREIADGLVVGEIGLLDPAFGLRAADPEP